MSVLRGAIVAVVVVGVSSWGTRPTAVAAGDDSKASGQAATFQAAFEKVAPAVVRIMDSSRYCSGVIVSDDGLVVAHRGPVEKKNEASVLFPDGKKHKAKVLVRDPETQLAVLQLQPEEKDRTALGGPSSKPSWPAAPLGSSASLRVGVWVATVAYPYGADVKNRSEATLSADILAGRTRLGGKSTYKDEVLLTDAAMNAGSEGGALITADGRVVGILLGPERHEAIKIAVNAAVPVEAVPALLKRARENPDPPVAEEAAARRTYGFLGVVWSQADPKAIIGELVPEGPAEKAGLQVGDAIVKADDKTIQTFEELIEFLKDTRPGQKVRLTIQRQGAEGETKKEIEVTLGEYPKEE